MPVAVLPDHLQYAAIVRVCGRSASARDLRAGAVRALYRVTQSVTFAALRRAAPVFRPENIDRAALNIRNVAVGRAQNEIGAAVWFYVTDAGRMRR